MARLCLNYDAISVNGINYLDTSINYLNSVISYLQQNSVPADFYRYNTFMNTLADLKKQRDKLVSFKKWLVNSNTDYDNLISKLESHANTLPIGRIKKRTTVIR